MAIAAVLKQHSRFVVYNEDGKQTALVQGHVGDTVIGYTTATFSLRQGHLIKLYDEAGKLKRSIPIRGGE